MHKDKLVTEAVELSSFVINLQFERAMVCLALFLDVRSGKATDLTKEYGKTDESLQNIKWRQFGTERVFENKLRFQIRIDDFRERISKITLLAANSTRQVTDTEVMEFYNLATSKILTGLEVNKLFPQPNNVECGFIHEQFFSGRFIKSPKWKEFQNITDLLQSNSIA